MKEASQLLPGDVVVETVAGVLMVYEVAFTTIRNNLIEVAIVEDDSSDEPLCHLYGLREKLTVYENCERIRSAHGKFLSRGWRSGERS